MDETLNLLAFDVGNSTVRVLLCRYDGSSVKSETILSEPNETVKVGEYFYWDMLRIFSVLKRGLREASRKARIDSIGVCTWGIDFMLLDERGNILSNALCYRNALGAEQLAKLDDAQRREMFYRTGILCDKINTVYMLRGMQEHMPSILAAAKKILLVPDVFVYMFTGCLCNEPSELSTTQMLNVQTMRISEEQCAYCGVTSDIFSEIGTHGKAVGNVKREILEELGIGYDIPFVCVPSHDTACAVMAIPSLEEEYLFVSAGTWALIGAQCPQAIVNDEVLHADLTNEYGAFGRTTLLRNSIGMFITQKLKAEYEFETNGKISWDDFTALAQPYMASAPTFDVNDPRFFNPPFMAREIQNAARPGAADGLCWGEILASAYLSLGDSYAENLAQLRRCTGRSYDRVYIVGGGARNTLINQRCADRLGMEVVTCDMECSSVGNAVSQLAYFHPEYSYEQLREIIVRSLEVRILRPNGQ